MQSSCCFWLLSLLVTTLLVNLATANSHSQRYDLVRSAHQSTHYLPHSAVNANKKIKQQPDYHISVAPNPIVLITVPGDGDTIVPHSSAKPSVINANSTTSSTAPATSPTSHDTGNSPATISTELSSNSTTNYTQAINSHVDVILYCTIDSIFCQKVGNALGAAAYKLAQVVGLKSKLM